MKDIAFAMFSKDEFNLRNCDSNLEVTAKPAALSDGLDSFDPDDSRFKELESSRVLVNRFLADFSATLLELMTTEFLSLNYFMVKPAEAPRLLL